VEKDERDVCYVWGRTSHRRIWWGNMKEIANLENLDVDGE